jgi:hypothetical protein
VEVLKGDIIEGSNLQFSVHGCHATVSPMQLPYWLPHHTMEAMVAHFTNILCQEIKYMMLQHCSKAPMVPFRKVGTVAVQHSHHAKLQVRKHAFSGRWGFHIFNSCI